MWDFRNFVAENVYRKCPWIVWIDGLSSVSYALFVCTFCMYYLLNWISRDLSPPSRHLPPPEMLFPPQNFIGKRESHKFNQDQAQVCNMDASFIAVYFSSSPPVITALIDRRSAISQFFFNRKTGKVVAWNWPDFMASRSAWIEISIKRLFWKFKIPFP